MEMSNFGLERAARTPTVAAGGLVHMRRSVDDGRCSPSAFSRIGEV
jgi:hypothetical protein